MSLLEPNPERWRFVETLFHQASEMDPKERPAFLERACRDDAALLTEVESLLASADQTLSFLEKPTSQAAREFTSDSPRAGKLIGPWRILSAIGEGGMGKVYLACRADEVYEQQVAMKVMRGDFGDEHDMLLRFRAERQILAKLNHPNIARLLDGGIC